VTVVTIDGDQLGELAVERRTVNQQPDLVVMVGKHIKDNSARLVVGLEETAPTIVDDHIANGWGLHIVERTEAVSRDANVTWAWHRGVAAELGWRKF